MIEQLRTAMQTSIANSEVAGVGVLVQKGDEEICFLAEDRRHI